MKGNRKNDLVYQCNIIHSCPELFEFPHNVEQFKQYHTSDEQIGEFDLQFVLRPREEQSELNVGGELTTDNNPYHIYLTIPD